MKINKGSGGLTNEQMQMMQNQQFMQGQSQDMGMMVNPQFNQMQGQIINNPQMNGQKQMQNTQMSAMEQSMQNGFVPMIPIAFDKEFAIVLIIMSFLLPLMGNGIKAQFVWQIISFAIVCGYTVSFFLKLRRKGMKLGLFGCILVDIAVGIGSVLVFLILSKSNIVIAIAQSIIWTFECLISQFIGALIIRGKNKKQFKIMKNIEKQRQHYERKLDKIYGKGKH